MASKKNFKVLFNAPVTLAFIITAFLILLLDKFALKNFLLIQNLFSVPGALARDISGASKAMGSGGMTVFNFSNPLHYVRLFLHILGNSSWHGFLFSAGIILLSGPQMEERYGSVSVAVMLFLSALVSGVLNACFIPQIMTGPFPFVLMLIILSSITSLSKNEISLATVLLFLVCLSEIFLELPELNKISVLGIFVQLAGALAGSLAGFLTASKTRGASARKNYNDEETTVIGSINI